jgi:hypothetical protein
MLECLIDEGFQAKDLDLTAVRAATFLGSFAGNDVEMLFAAVAIDHHWMSLRTQKVRHSFIWLWQGAGNFD